MEKFTRYIIRAKRGDILAAEQSVLDVGCGNGRNLVFLGREFGLRGTGYDISTSAIEQAKAASTELDFDYTARSIAGPLTIPDNSQSLVLDMMTSHFLNQKERLFLRDEIHRILIPGGFLFMKTFLADEDLHTRRLLRDFPGKEAGAYVHPVIGVDEYVYSLETLTDFLSEKFIVHKIYKSHRHVLKGKARKRRTVSMYVEKDYQTNR